MITSNDLFSQKFGYDLYKGNKSVDQLIGQAEIDVVGISLDEQQSHIYAIDVAFHEAGLNYGSKVETVTRVIKKCIRTAMCVYGYFGLHTGTIIFTSPKINQSIEHDLMDCIDDIKLVLKDLGINYEILIIGNSNFSESILEPVLNVLGDVADTSELFMRSLQLYNLFAEKKLKKTKQKMVTNITKATPDLEVIDSKGDDRFEEMKIGEIVRSIFRQMLENGSVSKEEITKMQYKNYSKDTFHIQYPLLLSANSIDKKPARYYSKPLKVYGEAYYLCSEWYEKPNRPCLLKWIETYMQNKL